MWVPFCRRCRSIRGRAKSAQPRPPLKDPTEAEAPPQPAFDLPHSSLSIQPSQTSLTALPVPTPQADPTEVAAPTTHQPDGRASAPSQVATPPHPSLWAELHLLHTTTAAEGWNRCSRICIACRNRHIQRRPQEVSAFVSAPAWPNADAFPSCLERKPSQRAPSVANGPRTQLPPSTPAPPSAARPSQPPLRYVGPWCDAQRQMAWNQQWWDDWWSAKPWWDDRGATTAGAVTSGTG